MANTGQWRIKSTSTSTAVYLNPINAIVVQVDGAGMPPVVNVTTPYGLIDGSLYQRTIYAERLITLTIDVDTRYLSKSTNCYQALHNVRQELVNLVHRDRSTPVEPFLLQYILEGQIAEIEAYYNGGLEWTFASTMGYGEEIILTMLCPNPFWTRVGDLTAIPSIDTTLNIGNVLLQSSWNDLDGGVNTECFDVIKFGSNVYFFGEFSQAGLTPLIDVNNAAYWDGANWNVLSNSGGSGLLPTDISSLEGWWDADDTSTLWQDSAKTTAITADGQTVGAWEDKSGNGRDWTQFFAGFKPTYKTSIQNGMDIIRFNGASNYMLATSNKWQSLFIVLSVTSVSGTDTLTLVPFSNGSNSPGTIVQTNNLATLTAFIVDPVTTNRRNGNNFSVTDLSSQFSTLFIGVQGTDVFLRQDNDEKTPSSQTDDLSSAGGTNMVLGARADGSGGNPANHMNCDIAEMFIYSKQMEEWEILELTSYIANKWGITAIIDGFGNTIYDANIEGSDIYCGGADGLVYTYTPGTSTRAIIDIADTEFPVNGNILDIDTIDSPVDIHFVGDFTKAGSDGYLWYDGSAGSVQTTSIGTHGKTVRAVVAVSATQIFVGGDFTISDGAQGDYIAIYNSSASTWSIPGTTGFDGSVYDMVYDSGSGNLYCVGEFSTVDSITARGIAVWNGSSWSGLGVGIQTTGARTIEFVSVTEIYVGGSFTSLGDGTSIPFFRVAVWDGSSWSAQNTILNDPIGLSGLTVNSILNDTAGLYYGFNQYATWQKYTDTINYQGDANGTPTITITSLNGTVISIVNQTQGTNLSFSGLVMGSAQTLVITLEPGNFSVLLDGVSQLDKLAESSNQSTFGLVTGNNSLEYFLTVTSGTPSIVLSYEDRLVSLDRLAVL